MRVLLDECLPKQLKKEFIKNHEVFTVPEMGWAGKKNGELLALASSKFDLFLTVDQNLTYQQNLKSAKIGVIVLVTKNNRLESFQLLIPKVLKLLQQDSIKGILLIS
jgi:predicted nuclease of predicted toxin-antitoxin system